MKLLLGSDLHLEFKGQQELPELPDYDVAILAGDIGASTQGFKWACEYFPADKPVLYIPGNHEYYGRDMIALDKEFLAVAKESKNVHLINFGSAEIGNVNFVGATLWTDFKLAGYKNYLPEQWARSIGDFQVIKANDKMFQPKNAALLHEEHKLHISNNLNRNYGKKNVVVTHFMPSQQCISNFFKGNALNPYFCNDMDNIISRYKPDLWLYGHTHDKGDKIHSSGKTRMVANPRGYPKEKKDYFKWKILEL